MKHNIIAYFLLTIIFIWDPPIIGNPPVGYVVSLSDKLGQIVETATVTKPTYSTDYEGTLLLSVVAIDEIGGTSPPSEWSAYQISEKELNYLRLHATKVDVPMLIFTLGYVRTMYEIWEDPNENNE